MDGYAGYASCVANDNANAIALNFFKPLHQYGSV
jgi:hypothetical protein